LTGSLVRGTLSLTAKGKSMINHVVLAKQARKDIRTLPIHIIRKFTDWVETLRLFGLDEVRKRPGYHDEPLKGKRLGQRSIRLSQAYRAIYVIMEDQTIEFVSVEEINKHDY
jgi:proteic killer suppression protein